MVTVAVYSGVNTNIATDKTNTKIFLSANETYNIVDGGQSPVLRRVCMEVDNSATEWELMKGSCDALHQINFIPDHQVIQGTATTSVGYLFYLLKGSHIYVEVFGGSGYIRFYRATDASEVNKLEEYCMNGEESLWLHCEVKENETTTACNTPVVQDPAHYYLCFFPAQPMPFRIDTEKMLYNTSEYEPCRVYYLDNEGRGVSTISVYKCCELSHNLFHALASPGCVLVSASCEDVGCLNRAVNITITSVGQKDVTGGVAAAVVVVAAVLVVMVAMCAMVEYKVRHQDRHIRGFQFDWFKDYGVH